MSKRLVESDGKHRLAGAAAPATACVVYVLVFMAMRGYMDSGWVNFVAGAAAVVTAAVVGRQVRRALGGRRAVSAPPLSPGSFAVVLHDPGPDKIQAIKIIREGTGLSRRQCKDAVDATPIVLPLPFWKTADSRLSAWEATNRLSAALTAIGATATPTEIAEIATPINPASIIAAAPPIDAC